ncbi:hypothetical protein ACGF1Z_06235 [Streptomyces sp. NPDC048018]|uniref:hypothetical protein n=1 Tax=Streptomyces sp. NPDC048018 TaxID=3365499 RepID=UPI00370FBDC0
MQWPLTVRGYADGAVVRTAEGRARRGGLIGSGLRDGSPAPVIAEIVERLESRPDAHRLMESNTHTGRIVVRIPH